MERALGLVEDFLSGTACESQATPIVEEVLFNHAFKHSLVYAGRAIQAFLEQQGQSVTLRYCESPGHGHPLPFLVVKDSHRPHTLPSEAEIRRAAKAVDIVVLDGSRRATTIRRQSKHKEGSWAIVVMPMMTRNPPAFSKSSW